MERQKTIVFTHIPKVAGLLIREAILRKNLKVYSSREIIREFIKDDYLSDYFHGDKRIDFKPQCITAHFPHGIHKIFGLSNEEVSYFTFLRDPIKRWISTLYFTHNDKYLIDTNKSSLDIYKGFLKSNGDIKKYLEFCINNNINSNSMTRQLSGIEDIRLIENNTIKLVNKKYNINHIQTLTITAYEYYLRFYRALYYKKSFKKAFFTNRNLYNPEKSKYQTSTYRLKTILGSLENNLFSRFNNIYEDSFSVYDVCYDQSRSYTDSEMNDFLHQAKQNLSKYSFVGFNDNIKSDVDKLCKLYGWESPTYLPKINPTEYFRLKQIEIDNEVEEMLVELNRFDIMLFKWAKKQFENKIN